MIERCEFVVKIPIHICVNLAMAGAIIMYDRMISLGRFAERPVHVGGPKHLQGGPATRQTGLSAANARQAKKAAPGAVDGLGESATHRSDPRQSDQSAALMEKALRQNFARFVCLNREISLEHRFCE